MLYGDTYPRWSRAHHSLTDAERLLLAEALREPRNQRFLLVSETTLPLYSGPLLYAQAMAEQHSRVQGCQRKDVMVVRCWRCTWLRVMMRLLPTPRETSSGGTHAWRQPASRRTTGAKRASGLPPHGGMHLCWLLIVRLTMRLSAFASRTSTSKQAFQSRAAATFVCCLTLLMNYNMQSTGALPGHCSGGGGPGQRDQL